MAFSLRAVFNEAVEIGKAAARLLVGPAQEHAYSSGSHVNLGSTFAGHEIRAAARLAPAQSEGIKKGSPFGNAR